MKQWHERGFTLIELMIVIAIVAIVTVVAIGKFADIRVTAARRANAANIKNIDRTIRTALADKDLKEESVKGLFAYCEALIDVDGNKVPEGAAGSYRWAPASGWYDGAGGVIPGIYCGVKSSAVVENAAGVTTGVAQDLAVAHESNVGMDKFAPSLGIYYLNEKEVASLNDAGIGIVAYHNYSNAQATKLGWSGSVWEQTYNLHSVGGGPGHRPDLSACFPAVLTNGMAVAILNPAKCETIYRDLGLDFGSTNNVTGISASSPETYFARGICKRVVVLGMGRDSEINTKYFENLPRNETLDKTHYRNYLLCFTMNNGQGNQGTAVKFAGVLDSQGNTWKGAQYTADWAAQ